MDMRERDSLIHGLQFTPFAATQKLQAIANSAPDEWLEVIKEYLRNASKLADMSAGVSVLSMASRCGMKEMLFQWVSANWDAVGQGGRHSFLYGALARSMNTPLEYLLDLYERETTTDGDRFRIFAGLFAVSKVCGCEQEVERMAKQLSASSDPEVRQRAAHLARRLATER
jgi:hypothetical protein